MKRNIKELIVKENKRLEKLALELRENNISTQDEIKKIKKIIAKKLHGKK